MEHSQLASDFFEEIKSRRTRNVLLPFKSDIMYLRTNGLTYKEIHEFLTTKLNLNVSKQTVRNFLIKHEGANQKNKPIRNIESNPAKKSDSGDDDDEYLTSPFTGERVKRSEVF